MAFEVIINDVTRDVFQGKNKNKPPLDDSRNLEAYSLQNDLVVSTKNHDKPFRFSAGETGGAQSQVDAMFRNANFMDTVKNMREAAPDMAVRVLWRGANGVKLEPSAVDELKFMLKQYTNEIAGFHLLSDEQKEKFLNKGVAEYIKQEFEEQGLGYELFRVKGFDSQADSRELRSSIAIVSELYHSGFPVAMEVGIPYSNGEGVHDPYNPERNPYPDEFYVGNFEQLMEYAEEFDYPLSLLLAGPKDMVGELTSENTVRLLNKIMDVCDEKGVKPTIPLHLHDTGLSLDTYVAAIKLAKDRGWPIAIDTAEGQEYSTGFVSALDLNEALLKEDIDLGFTAEHIRNLEKQRSLHDAVSHDYRLTRKTDGALEGADLRRYRVPGGGSGQFEADTKASGIALELGITDKEAIHLAGHGLMAVAPLMGHALAVTPGFRNKSLAAFSTLKNMIEQGALNKDMSYDEMLDRMLQPMTDTEVENFFLKNLSPKVEAFMSGEMPVELHPVVRAKFPKRNGVVTDGMKSSLEERTQIVKNLQDEGYIAPTKLQLKQLLTEAEYAERLVPNLEKRLEEMQKQFNFSEFGEAILVKEIEKFKNLIGALPKDIEINDQLLNKLVFEADENQYPKNTNGQTWQEDIKAKLENELGLGPEQSSKLMQRLEDMTIASGIMHSMPLTAKDFEDRIKKPWLKEPDAMEFQDNPEAYHRMMGKFSIGLNPLPDAVEKVRIQQMDGAISLDQAHKDVYSFLQQEQHELKESVVQFISENKPQFAAAVDLALSESNKEDEVYRNSQVDTMIENLLDYQSNLLINKMNEGEKFLYTDKERMDIAVDYLKSQIKTISSQKGAYVASQAYLISERVDNYIDEKRADIEAATIKAPLSGTVLDVSVEPGQEVKKGDTLYVIEAMKMENTIRASKDGVIGEVNVSSGKSVEQGDVLMTFGDGLEVSSTTSELSSNEPVSYFEKQYIEKLQSRSTYSSIGKYIEAKQDELSEEGLEINQKVQEILERGDSYEKGDVQQGSTIEQSEASKRGYNTTRPLSLNKENSLDIGDCIHVIMNRTGCATKIYGDLQQSGETDIRVLYTQGDSTTPIIKNANEGQKIEVKNYMDQEAIIEIAKDLAEKNPGKKIALHPGWGFLSEKADFVAKVEELENPNIVFVGPKSKPMDEVGDKLKFRELVEEVAPEVNPKFFKAEGMTIAEFEKVRKMGGDVMIKAVAGGGGRGIERFQVGVDGKGKEFEQAIQEVQRTGEKLFNNPTVMVEQRFQGSAHHIEIQVACSNGEAICLGMRNCTAQNKGQKFIELNIIEGDYDKALIDKLNKAGLEIAKRNAKEGYEGVGTLEFMVDAKTHEITILEKNTRLQVEHAVTEEDIYLKTGKQMSLPLLNAHLVLNNGKGPEQIMQELYGITPEEIRRVNQPGQERVTHIRLNSKVLNFKDGNAEGKPDMTKVADDKWIDGIATEISGKYNVNLVRGGLGDGKSDPQIGAIWGKESDVLAASQELMKMFRLTQVYDRSNSKMNLEGALQVYQIMFDENDKLKPDFNIGTVDSIKKSISKENGISSPVAANNNQTKWPGENVIKGGKLEESHWELQNLQAAELERSKSFKRL